MPTFDAMTAAAKEFLAGLDEAGREAGQRPMTDERLRRDWTYLPGRREGVALGDLDRAGRKAAHRLVATALRAHAYAQVASIMALEDVLDRSEGYRRSRHSADYWTIVFGEPGSGEPWSWRFEGHHVSVNVTVAAGEVSATPSFLGANPAMVRYGDHLVLRPLAPEEERARALLDAMDSRCRAMAIVDGQAPPDLRTRMAPRVSAALHPLGVPRADLGSRAADLLDRLTETFVERLPDDLAEIENARIDRKSMHFAWEGSTERGAGHYYRIQAPHLLIEYDNTQNQANHVHTVWRRPRGDFGEDLLTPPLAGPTP